jgi:eukaryotic-like serine/threonine-protein kinase
MATVYVARDERHDRQVALKVLKPELAAVVGAERFLAEIRTTANLQHPHILQLYDSGEADGLLYFVMPFVDGETLGDRLEREKQLPVDEAVGLARAIAAALHAAHERGVIHRDIKPANILLSHGEPVVADFGIALAIQEAGGGRLTETGLSIGTPFYMSPEQATGDRDPDVRSDIYSLGTLLYEMLTGEPPFQGTTAQAVLGKILTGSPSPPTEYRKSIPPHVEAVILKSLERLPADRFSSAAEFGDALGNPAFRHGTEAISAGLEASHERIRRLQRNVRRFAGATVVLAGAVILLLLPGFGGPGAENPVVEFYVQGDSTHQVMSGVPGSVALSPDGRTLAYVGTRADIGRQIFVRSLDDRAARPIPGSEGAHDVFFSPDGDWLGFSDMENELVPGRRDPGGGLGTGPPRLRHLPPPFGRQWLSGVVPGPPAESGTHRSRVHARREAASLGRGGGRQWAPGIHHLRGTRRGGGR